MTDSIDFDPPQTNEREQSDVTAAATRIASLNARAVMPNGKLMDRGEILATLGLNPNTAPTAWLNVIGCGSNASALLPGDLQRVTASRLAAVSNVLNQVSGLTPEVGSSASASGFVSGGAMRDSTAGK